MVEEQLGQEAEVLAVELVVAAVHLEDGERALAVDLLARRLATHALASVVSEKKNRAKSLVGG